MQVQPYLFFEGRCDEAIKFYTRALGAKVTMLMRFKDSPEQQKCPTVDAEKVMHAQFTVGDTTIMASDGRCDKEAKFLGFSLSIDAATVPEAEKLFAALSEGGQVQMPLGKTFFSPAFGMVADRFGVSWMIMVRPG